MLDVRLDSILQHSPVLHLTFVAHRINCWITFPLHFPDVIVSGSYTLLFQLFDYSSLITSLRVTESLVAVRTRIRTHTTVRRAINYKTQTARD